MFDLSKVVPKALGDRHEYPILDGTSTTDGCRAAMEANFLIILATISNHLEQLSRTQQELLKGGQEAQKKADTALGTMLSLASGFKGA